MLLTTHHKLNPIVGNSLVGVENAGDKTFFHHAQNVSDVLEQNKKDRDVERKAFGQAKYKHIGRIPDILLLQHPEWVHDPSLMVKFLQSAEGEPYRTVKKI